jgi:murein L,D-transpeptidase YcbB/YkuD
VAKRLYAGAACAALMSLCAPVAAATVPSTPQSFRMFGIASEPGVQEFYASRGGSPLWLSRGADSPAVRELLSTLKRAQVEGLGQGPEIASQAEALLARASAGDRDALIEADRLLSTGWVRYVQLLRRAPSGMTVAEKWIAPRSQGPQEILQLASSAPSLDAHIRATAAVNPIYSALRNAAHSQVESSGMTDGRVIANLERMRVFPSKGRYIVVDAASARLWMIEDGSIADTMKVIVGKPSSQTPMIASVIHYATLNPYWNVPSDLVQRLIAPRVLSQGARYLKTHGYQVLSDFSENPQVIAPADVDWAAVAAGRATVRVRQLPGPGNSMGQLKFGFENNSGIFLHDTPQKELFAAENRDLSNGCVRLEDAQRLGRWLMGREPSTASSDPEQHVLLPKPVPVYVTYLTAQAQGGELTFVGDPYGRDMGGVAALASLR